MSLLVEVVDPEAVVRSVRDRLATTSPGALDAYPVGDVMGAILGQANAARMVEKLGGLRPLESDMTLSIVEALPPEVDDA